MADPAAASAMRMHADSFGLAPAANKADVSFEIHKYCGMMAHMMMILPNFAPQSIRGQYRSYEAGLGVGNIIEKIIDSRYIGIFTTYQQIIVIEKNRFVN